MESSGRVRFFATNHRKHQIFMFALVLSREAIYCPSSFRTSRTLCLLLAITIYGPSRAVVSNKKSRVALVQYILISALGERHRHPHLPVLIWDLVENNGSSNQNDDDEMRKAGKFSTDGSRREYWSPLPKVTRLGRSDINCTNKCKLSRPQSETTRMPDHGCWGSKPCSRYF